MTCSGSSYDTNYEKDAMFGSKINGEEFEARRVRLMHSSHFGYASLLSDEERRSPYVSPVYGDYHGFPPMFFAVGENELLLSDTLSIVEKLTNEKTKVKCMIGEGMFHIYALFPSLIPEATVVFKELAVFSKDIFSD